jgi:hypothetical protein
MIDGYLNDDTEKKEMIIILDILRGPVVIYIPFMVHSDTNSPAI